MHRLTTTGATALARRAVNRWCTLCFKRLSVQQARRHPHRFRTSASMPATAASAASAAHTRVNPQAHLTLMPGVSGRAFSQSKPRYFSSPHVTQTPKGQGWALHADMRWPCLFEFLPASCLAWHRSVPPLATTWQVQRRLLDDFAFLRLAQHYVNLRIQGIRDDPPTGDHGFLEFRLGPNNPKSLKLSTSRIQR